MVLSIDPNVGQCKQRKFLVNVAYFTTLISRLPLSIQSIVATTGPDVSMRNCKTEVHPCSESTRAILFSEKIEYQGDTPGKPQGYNRSSFRLLRRISILEKKSKRQPSIPG